MLGAPETRPGIMDLGKVALNPPPKCKGGRTSRRAMKKNKSYNIDQKESGSSTKRPEIALDEAEPDVDDVVPLPTTPDTQKETTLSAKCADECMVSYPADSDEDKVDNGENNNNLPEPPHKEIEGLGMGMNIEKENELVLGPCDDQGINEGVFCFNDVLDSKLMDANGILTPNEETKSNGVASCPHCGSNLASSHEELETSAITGNLSTNGREVADLNSCSSMTSAFAEGPADSWDWESSLVQDQESCNEKEKMLSRLSEGDNWEGSIVQSQESCSEKEKMLSWLWESDDCESHDFEEVLDSDKQSAMVAWLLS